MQLAGTSLNIQLYMPVFAKAGLDAKTSGTAEAGGYFKVQAKYGVIWINDYVSCNTDACKRAKEECSEMM
jgi:hypothetical protein